MVLEFLNDRDTRNTLTGQNKRGLADPLGFGVQPPLPSWGLMIAEGKRFIFGQPWMTLIPGAAICVLVLAVNMLGDSIRDYVFKGLSPSINSRVPRKLRA